jgi:hypothetical protein
VGQWSTSVLTKSKIEDVAMSTVAGGQTSPAATISATHGRATSTKRNYMPQGNYWW